MEWNHNLAEAPRGRTVIAKGKVKEGKIYVEADVEKIVCDTILAVQTNGEVVRTYWIPARYTQSGHLLDGNRWSGFNVGQEPIAWMPWPTYEPPKAEPVKRVRRKKADA